MPNQIPYDQLLTSRLNRQKLCLDNSIAFYVDSPKVDMLPFADEIDVNTTLVLDRSEEDKDDKESSDDEDLKTENPEVHSSAKRKRSANTRNFPVDKKSAQTRHQHLEVIPPLKMLQRLQQILKLQSKSK